MRISRLLSIGLLASFGLSAIAQVASAVPIAAQEATSLDIYVSGLSGYQKLVAEYPNVFKNYKKSANECGFLKLSASSTSTPILPGHSLRLNGIDFTVASLPVEAAPKCTNGVLSGTNLTPSAKLKTPEGDVYLTGLGAFSKNNISYVSLPTKRSVSANTCGIAKLSATGDYFLPSGNIVLKDKASGATLITVNVDTVEAVMAGAACKSGVALFPTDWPTTP